MTSGTSRVGPRLFSAALLRDWVVVTTDGTLVSQADIKRHTVSRGSAATAIVCVGVARDALPPG